MNVAKDFQQLFDSVADIVNVAGETERVVFVPVASELLPQLIEGVEPKRVWLQHHGTPGLYELVVEQHDGSLVAPAPRP